jgi:tetratricopeptide (TPR) repeat protein
VIRLRLPLLLLIALPCALDAQRSPLDVGTAAMNAWDLSTARQQLELAVARDSASYEANWRLAIVLMDLGKVTPDSVRSPARDSLYAAAETYARRAVAVNPDGAEGHFALAAAIGRASLTMGKRERIRRAAQVRSEALRTLAIDPHHDGAYHVLGRWNAEIERLSGLEKFFAKTFLGAGIFGQASWAEAERNLRLAVQYAPERIYHRLDLAQVLADRGEWEAAKAELDSLALLPPAEPMDATYKREAQRLAVRVAARLKS